MYKKLKLASYCRRDCYYAGVRLCTGSENLSAISYALWNYCVEFVLFLVILDSGVRVWWTAFFRIAFGWHFCRAFCCLFGFWWLLCQTTEFSYHLMHVDVEFNNFLSSRAFCLSLLILLTTGNSNCNFHGLLFPGFIDHILEQSFWKEIQSMQDLIN